MSASVELVRLLVGTGLAKRIDEFVVMVFGKDVVHITAKELEGMAGKALVKESEAALRIFEAAMLGEASHAFPKMSVLFPELLHGMDEEAFAEILHVIASRGARSAEAVRGLLVERLLRILPEFKNLPAAMDLIVSAANKRAKGWGPARLVTGVVDGHQKELGDLLFVSMHKDGRVWILAVIESKSFSNISHLGRLKDLPVGQHLWDWARAKSRGLTIDGAFYKRTKVVMEPVPLSEKVGAGVVGAKATADRVAEMSKGLYTEFIGFIPKEMSDADIRAVVEQGIQVEAWGWPFDLAELAKFQKAAGKLVDQALGL